jgi:hypothetical protein
MIKAMDDVVLRPFMGLSGEYSVIMASDSGGVRSVDVIASDEFDAVTVALVETGWNHSGEITVDDQNTLENDLEPLLCFEYVPV